MSFTPASIKKGEIGVLNTFLAENSFIAGPVASQEDVKIFKAVAADFDVKKYPHIARWYYYIRGIPYHVLSSLPATGSQTSSESSSSSASSSSSSGSSSSGSSSSDEEETEEERLAREKLEKYNAKAAANIAKEQSNVVFDVTGEDPETDMNAVADAIREISMESLIWGISHEVMEIAFGIKAVRIGCTITNVKVSTDDLEAAIEDVPGVSRVQIIAFQKI